MVYAKLDFIATFMAANELLVEQDKNCKGSTKEMKNLSNSRKQKGNRRRISKDNFQKLESKDLEAANEVWTFMNRDYPGNGGVRHNPPTNNR